ncbi:LPS-assembly protein LptD [Mangrovicoccus algicola]|uniref:LPS-assembly protein LptD n=1 Tax=Mangrovicoccus algicola TaxID=2771008 RepID=A0A8J7CUP4_9RHOB|nr:LPS assembly protein LptD [Mangrovicoccus algicola]MBE3637769.1 LPS-assembly protein LptD [Mangrovicoccus algicola]
MSLIPAPRRNRFIAALLVSFGIGLALPAAAQEGPVTLVADQVIVESQSVLIAEGSVEVFSEGRHMRATRLVYDQDSDRLSVEGPITLTEGEDTVVLADAAELSTDLREGIIEGVRVILGQQVQIAASSAQRQQGRFTDLRDTVATSCEVCSPGEEPLWHIRAQRVIHDEERKRIYFQHAQFRVLGVPVAYLPAMSVPTPDVTRAAGFLVPSVESDDLYGSGLRLPYFVPLGDHADLTFAPFLAVDPNGDTTETLEMRYRQAFTAGDIGFEGAVTQDDQDHGTRGYLFGSGAFDLPWQTELTFGIQLVTDEDYLSDYDYAGDDRLSNSLGLLRVVGDSRFEAELVTFNTLRDDEDNDTIPTLAGDARYDRRWQPAMLPGYLDLALIGHGHERSSDEDGTGRDMAQARGFLRWGDVVTAGPGIRLSGDLRAIADAKHIVQDSRYETFQTALTPGASVGASLPMAKSGRNGVSYLLEPMAQAVWVGDYDIDSPNDDSTQPAFDAGNLLGYQRYPGLDRVEDGFRTNLALRWQRLSPEGWSLGLTFGRILRGTDAGYSPGTGLGGVSSDWLTQVDLDVGGLTLRNLALISDDGSFTLNEARVNYTWDDLEVDLGYVWQIEDEDLNQDEDLGEITFDGSYRFNDTWSSTLYLRRDMISEQTTRANLGVAWQNECVKVDVSGGRRFKSSGSGPTYSYGLMVTLNGFGNGGSGTKRAGRCS